MATNDPVIRYTAGGVLLAAFLATLAVAMHGYWVSPDYQLPPFVASILSAGVGGALTLLGVHLGGVGTTQAVTQGAQAASQGAAVVTEAGKNSTP
jgi:hypothetical protein